MPPGRMPTMAAPAPTTDTKPAPLPVWVHFYLFACFLVSAAAGGIAYTWTH